MKLPSSRVPARLARCLLRELGHHVPCNKLPDVEEMRLKVEGALRWYWLDKAYRTKHPRSAPFRDRHTGDVIRDLKSEMIRRLVDIWTGYGGKPRTSFNHRTQQGAGPQVRFVYYTARWFRLDISPTGVQERLDLIQGRKKPRN
jgi:hypothetical protein